MPSQQKVLVVDDDATLCRAIVEMLECLGYRAVAASTVQEALKIVEDDASFTAILLDVLMPEKGAPCFLREYGGEVPVIPMSGKPEQLDLCEPFTSVAVTILKPVLEEMVVEALKIARKGRKNGVTRLQHTS